MRTKFFLRLGFLLPFVMLSLFTAQVSAQEPAPPEQELQTVFPKKPPYSLYADRHFPERVYWGDTQAYCTEAASLAD